MYHCNKRKSLAAKKVVDAEETEKLLMRTSHEEFERKNMTNPEVAIMMMGVFILFVLLGFPIAFTLLAMGVGLVIMLITQTHDLNF